MIELDLMQIQLPAKSQQEILLALLIHILVLVRHEVKKVTQDHREKAEQKLRHSLKQYSQRIQTVLQKGHTKLKIQVYSEHR